MCFNPHGEFVGCFAEEFCTDWGGVTCYDCLAGRDCEEADRLNLAYGVDDTYCGWDIVVDGKFMLFPVGVLIPEEPYTAVIDFHEEALWTREMKAEERKEVSDG